MSNLLMFFVLPYTMLFGFGTLSLYGVVGFQHWWEALIVAIFALPALSSGLDLLRHTLKKLVDIIPALGQREIFARLALLLGLFIVPLPLTAVFYVGHLIAPEHMGTINGFGEAFRLSESMAILIGILYLADFSVSIRSLITRYNEQRDLDLRDPWGPTAPTLPGNPTGGGDARTPPGGGHPSDKKPTTGQFSDNPPRAGNPGDRPGTGPTSGIYW